MVSLAAQAKPLFPGIHAYIRAIWWALVISWKAAVTMTEPRLCPAVRFTAEIEICRFTTATRNHPVSLYAAGKKPDGHTYSHLYGCQRRLRFTVYARDAPTWPRCCCQGDFGGEPIKVFNYGDAEDFTYRRHR